MHLKIVPFDESENDPQRFTARGDLLYEDVGALWARYLEELGSEGVAVSILPPAEVLPMTAVVYLMLDAGRVQYVGKASNLAHRMRYHQHQWWERLVVIRIPRWWPYHQWDEWLAPMERAAWERFRPEENREIPRVMQPAAFDLAPLFEPLPDDWSAWI